MKIFKTYETFIGKKVPTEYDADFAMAKIKYFYSDSEIKDMFDDELKNWISEDEIADSWENIYEWFYDSYKEESLSQEVVDKKREIAIAVSEIVIEQIMDWYEREFNKELTEEQREGLAKLLIKHYEGIDPNNW